MQLETFEHDAPLTGTHQRQQRRQALERFADRHDHERIVRRLRLAYATINRLQQLLAEERTLRKMVEAENAELADRVRQLEAKLAYAKHCGA